MKNRFCAALLLAAFCMVLFTGCASVDALPQNVAAPEIIISEEPAPLVPAPAKATEPTPTETPTIVPTQPPVQPAQAEKTLTRDEAKQIALQHAGLTEDAVTRLKAEFDYDDGRPEYEVEFHHGGYEYDYEIHAETGKIIHWDKDWDD